jgi:hypothetical protein
MKADKYLLSLLLTLLCATLTNAMFAIPTYAPIDRLIANTEAFIKENPQKPDGYYTLARIHYLAFIDKASMVETWNPDSDSLPRTGKHWHTARAVDRLRQGHALQLALKELGLSSESDITRENRRDFSDAVERHDRQLKQQGWTPKRPADTQLVGYAAAALRNFKKAISLDPKNGLYHLGLASLLEQYVDFLNQINADTLPAEFRAIILEEAKDTYYAAYKFSIKRDRSLRFRPLEGIESLVSFEAGKAFIRLAEADSALSKNEKSNIASVRNGLKKLEALPDSGLVTPIVFTFSAHHSLADLLAPDLHVSFDLDGTGRNQLWPWVKSTTAILVWDPDRKGQITSGRQLFGSVTWWVFFADGYRALDALDDSRDGSLTGAELTGISLWFDRNANGISEPGEVVPIEETPVLSLATKATSYDNDSPVNERGLTLIDGRVLPSYDWITSPTELLP